MKIIKIAKNENTQKLEEVKSLLGEVCEDLKKEGVSSAACSIKLDLIELIESLKD